jgi:dTDP-4-amino-4,6-dideoxygalactose transaminase
MTRPPIDIERYYLSEYGRQGVLVPSGRFGIYAVVRSVFSPGDKVIISPITCRTVVLALFSGGITPVFVDVDKNTGNIDLEKISEKLLAEVRGVITSNLYGTPDRAKEIQVLCKKHGLFLLEDCAHIVDARIDGVRVGAIGDASVFSFYKFLNVQGGIVLSNDKNLLQNVRVVVENEGRNASRMESYIARIRSDLVRSVPGAKKIKNYIRNGLLKLKPDMSVAVTGRKSNILTFDGLAPLKTASLKPLHYYLSYSGKQYDKLPTEAAMERIRLAFGSIDEKVKLKRDMNDRLINRCPLELKKATYNADYCNLVVPYFTDNRTEIIKTLKEDMGIDVWYVYDPPLSDVFDPGSFVNEQKNPEIAEEWSKRVLPINSCYSDEFMEVIGMTDKGSGRRHINGEARQDAGASTPGADDVSIR